MKTAPLVSCVPVRSGLDNGMEVEAMLWKLSWSRLVRGDMVGGVGERPRVAVVARLELHEEWTESGSISLLSLSLSSMVPLLLLSMGSEVLQEEPAGRLKDDGGWKETKLQRKMKTRL